MFIRNRQKAALVFFAVFFTSAFFISCGLDVYPYFDPPYTDGHTAYYTSDDVTENYFSFVTNETSDNNTENDFLGTEVYYKIYNNYSTMVSAESSVSSLNSSTTNSTAAIENLIDTRGYKPLKLSTGSITPIIQDQGQNRYVYIRLNDYSSDSSGDYSSAIRIGTASISTSSDGSALTYNGTVVYPRRYINSSYGFNFNSGDSDNPLPESGDADLNYSSSASESGVWYVDMYAVSVGRDSTFTSYYSKVLFLGSVAIKEEDYND